MAKRTTKPKKNENSDNENPNAHIQGAGLVQEQPITKTLELNFMPYAISVILSRAIPEIDGFKPSHRKLLYTMYNMGLLKGARIKSANIVGRTMQLNPHGDASIYDTMVRLSRGNEALLHPFVDSKGNFGKAYSRNMAYAASRYTEAKLEAICAELFGDIDKDTVDFVPNYDNSMQEPTLLPVSFPNILCNCNLGIAVGMTSNICSFNLREICEATEALIKDEQADISSIIKGPDFVGGGKILYDHRTFNEIYENGRGSVKVRAVYEYDKANNCIDIKQIPPTTTSEAIIDKVIELVKANKAREIADIRDETDKTGLKITIDLKRGAGADADRLMNRLYRTTPLEDSFGCNFNILVGGTLMVLGVRGILIEWIGFRMECVTRRVIFDLNKAKKRLHLLEGLSLILLDIDKAIKIVRETEVEAEVVPNLMIGFGIDEVQAEYVAEIKLRHLNREYILKRLEDIDDLKKAIADMEDILGNKRRVKKIIIDELRAVSKKYGMDRRSEIVYDNDDDIIEEEDVVDAYPVTFFFTKEGYFKKITPQSLRMSANHKLKEGDEIISEIEADNSYELLFFSDKCQVYKAKADDFKDTKASSLGDYVAGVLGADEGENIIAMIPLKEYEGNMLFFFENGKAAKVDIKTYETKTNRKKLLNAYSDKSPLVALFFAPRDDMFKIGTTNGRYLLVNSAMIPQKTTKNTQGVQAITLRKNHFVKEVVRSDGSEFVNAKRYMSKNIPAAGAVLAAEDQGRQISLLDE
ncbi:MAG: topoisomerase IV [Clostridia bacterium]|nr:topoisomerase IV [Clostridia bacterium]